MKVKFKGVFVFALALVMGSAALLPARSFSTANAEEFVAAVETALESQSDLSVKVDEKVYCKATLEDDFADDSGVVVLKQSVSNYLGLAQSKLQNLFRLIDFSYIEDSYAFPNPSAELREHIEKVGYNQIVHIGLKKKSKTNVLNTIKLLEKLDFIVSAEPNYYHEIDSPNSVETVLNESANSSYETVPDDPMLKDQWGLVGDYGIGAKDAWKITTGSKEFRVGVIDSGSFIHDELYYNIDRGYDFCQQAGTPEYSHTSDDPTGHGTAVTGIIAAKADNGIGISGVVPNVSIISLQTVARNNEGKYLLSESAIKSAIEGATYGLIPIGRSIKILNYSAAGIEESSSIRYAIRLFPGLVVAAVGNAQQKFDGSAFMDIDNLITVGALNSKGSRWSKSNYGEYVDIYAPGENILTTKYKSDYTSLSATSYAAPFVTGVAALVLSKYPNLSGKELKQAIIDGAIPCTINTPEGQQSTCRLSAIGALMSAEKAVKPLQFTNLQVSSKGAKWQTRIENPNNFEVRVTFNERLCYEGDAMKFQNLIHLRTFNLAAGAGRTVQIYDNGTAGTMTACIETPYEGQTVRTVSYAYDLSSNGTMTAKYNRLLGTPFGTDGQVPGYVDMKAISKSGATYDIEVTNPNPYDVSITYNSKLCFENDAKWFKGLNDLVDTTIPAGGSKIVKISDNGTAHWATVAINYMIDGALFRRVSYADGLNNDGGIAHMNTPLNNEFAVTSSFPQTNIVPQYLKFTPIKKNGWLFPGWDVKIENPNGFQVQITYNSKLCFEADARDFKNLNDLVTITIPANSSKTVTIDGNGTAGTIGMCINYHFSGFDYRKVTYSCDFAVNSSKLQYNQIRFT